MQKYFTIAGILLINPNSNSTQMVKITKTRYLEMVTFSEGLLTNEGFTIYFIKGNIYLFFNCITNNKVVMEYIHVVYKKLCILHEY
ncbi:MAG: hypothetical protein ABI707_15960 [Ferruginibacter sp.]